MCISTELTLPWRMKGFPALASSHPAAVGWSYRLGLGGVGSEGGGVVGGLFRQKGLL